MRTSVEYITKCLFENEMIEESQIELYKYGLERFLYKMVSYLTLLLLALHMKLFIQSAVFLIFFILLRERTGGYHASTKLRCFIGTIGIYILPMKLVIPILIENNIIAWILLILSTLLIYIWAPVNHPNLQFDEGEVMMYRDKARKILAVEITIIFFSTIFNAEKSLIISEILGITLCAFLISIAKIIKQEVGNGEG